MTNYDVIIIGGGPGGYLAAERAGQAKLKTLCVEDRHLGGTCLNEGCIPTKTLLQSAKTYAHALHGEAYGVRVEKVSIDQSAVIDRKEKVVRTLVSGVGAALKASHVDVVNGRGVITGRSAEGVTVQVGEELYIGKNLIVATGSVNAQPPIPGLKEALDSGFALTNRELLSLRESPARLAVIGGGVIGLEMAAYYQLTGTAVTVVEMLDHIAGPNDPDLVKILHRNLEKDGMEFHLGTKVVAVKDGAVVCEKDGKTFDLPADKVLLAIGRKANSAGLGLENIGVELEKGAIVTDAHMKTNVPGVYAVGDVNGKFMLAHTAYREAEVAVNTILGKADTMRYEAIPSVLYTVPELSSVGLSEAEAKTKGYEVSVVKLPMQYSGRYVAENEGGDGICKLVFNSKRGTLLGAQVLANASSEFIIAAGIFIELELTVPEMREFVFPHPTVCEIFRDALAQYKGR